MITMTGQILIGHQYSKINTSINIQWGCIVRSCDVGTDGVARSMTNTISHLGKVLLTLLLPQTMNSDIPIHLHHQ